MMRVLLSPQRADRKINYTFGQDVITVEMDGVIDTFDFTQMPDGEMAGVETTLPINPIISARRVDGVLEVVLLNFVGPDASEEERFPDWIEVGENDG